MMTFSGFLVVGVFGFYWFSGGWIGVGVFKVLWFSVDCIGCWCF